MARIECNPECANCGKTIKSENRIIIQGEFIHDYCEDEFKECLHEAATEEGEGTGFN